MPSFKQRSYKKELLDRSDIPFEDIKEEYAGTGFHQQEAGGHDITLDGVVAFVQDGGHFNKAFTIVEIGCGGGDNLRAIKQWAEYIKLPVHLTGIDINAECIAYAREQKRNSDIMLFIPTIRM